MSKAEELAKEYAEKFFLTVDHQGDVEEAYIDGYHQAEEDLTDKAKVSSGWDGFYYGQGYKQAEKDLELTWEDIETILNMENDILRECNIKKELVLKTYPEGEDYYGEILKRFKERKEK